MKKYISLLLTACLALFIASCSDENEEARTPVAAVQFQIDNNTLNTNESMVIHFTGTADQVVIYPGDDSHNYALRDSSDTGIAVNKGLFTYSYSVPGVFHVVCVASTYDTYMGNNIRTDTCGFYVRVVDNITQLDRIYATITPNTYYAENVNGDDWLLCLPTKQLYNNKEVTINPAK